MPKQRNDVRCYFLQSFGLCDLLHSTIFVELERNNYFSVDPRPITCSLYQALQPVLVQCVGQNICLLLSLSGVAMHIHTCKKVNIICVAKSMNVIPRGENDDGDTHRWGSGGLWGGKWISYNWGASALILLVHTAAVDCYSSLKNLPDRESYSGIGCKKYAENWFS